jgi:hypothetical protein
MSVKDGMDNLGVIFLAKKDLKNEYKVLLYIQ